MDQAPKTEWRPEKSSVLMGPEESAHNTEPWCKVFGSICKLSALFSIITSLVVLSFDQH